MRIVRHHCSPFVLLSCLVWLGLLASGCQKMPPTTAPAASSSTGVASQATTTVPSSVQPSVPATAAGLSYQNPVYGFSFALPDSWQGYSIVEDQWQGYALDGPQNGEMTEQGPLLLIRHPLWTAAEPYQDIPIMVFTQNQWDQIGQETLSVGAAPIPPQELGHNEKYVFALPARYNYAYLKGYEEVENLLAENPLQPLPTT